MKKTTIEKQTMNVSITTVFCDKCDQEIKKGKYNEFCSTIELQVGERCGYYGSFAGQNYEVDLCESCAKTIFFEIFPANGIKVNERI